MLFRSNVDKVIGEDWHRVNISQMNTPYSCPGGSGDQCINEPPTNGSWYIGMSSDLQFTVDQPTVDLGDLYALNNYTATATTILTATTSYSGGYTVRAYASNNGELRLDTTDYIERWLYANSTPALWDNNCPSDSNYCGFGYTTSDTSLGPANDNRFATSTKYAGFATSTPGDPVGDSTAPAYGATTTITYKVSTQENKVAGSYTTTIYYLCTVNY